MNRSKEYTKIVQTSNIPQETLSKIKSPLIDLFIIDKRIKDTLCNITKCKYEVYNVRTKINEVQGMCKEVQSRIINLTPEYANSQEEENYTNVCNILKGRVSEYKLQILTYLRKSEKEEKEKQRRRSHYNYTEEQTPNTVNTINSNTLSCSVLEEGVRNRQREEITQQISEIGSIMEEIGLHVSMQEESFKRIDDLMKESDKLLDNSLYILKRGVEGVTGTRKSLMKFFVFWIILALIFWMFRRS